MISSTFTGSVFTSTGTSSIPASVLNLSPVRNLQIQTKFRLRKRNHVEVFATATPQVSSPLGDPATKARELVLDNVKAFLETELRFLFSRGVGSLKHFLLRHGMRLATCYRSSSLQYTTGIGEMRAVLEPWMQLYGALWVIKFCGLDFLFGARCMLVPSHGILQLLLPMVTDVAVCISSVCMH